MEQYTPENKPGSKAFTVIGIGVFLAIVGVLVYSQIPSVTSPTSSGDTLEKAKARVVQLQTRIDELKKQAGSHSTSDSQWVNLNHEIKETQEKLGTEQRHIATLQSQIKAGQTNGQNSHQLRQKLEALKQELANLPSVPSTGNSRSQDKIEEQIRMKQELLDFLNQKIDTLSMDLQEPDLPSSQAEAKKQEKKKAEKQKSDIQKDIISLRSQLNHPPATQSADSPGGKELQRQIAQLQDQLAQPDNTSSLERDLQQAQSQEKQLKARLSSLQKQIAALPPGKKDDSQVQIEKLTQELNQAQSEVRKLEREQQKAPPSATQPQRPKGSSVK
jgi:chromosome segregation ATPase